MLAGAEASLAAVRSGTGTVVGLWHPGSTRETWHGEPPALWPVAIDFEFDADRGGLRTARTGRDQGGTGKVKYVITAPTRTTLATGGEGTAGGVAGQFLPTDETRAFADRQHFVHPLGITFGSITHQHASPGVMLGVLQEQLAEVREVRRREDGVYELVWYGQSSPRSPVLVIRRLFDGNRGFLPIGTEMHRAPSLLLTSVRSSVDARSSTTWIERNGVWVPETVTTEYLGGYSVPRSLALTYEWSSVNRPVAADRFDWQTLDLPAGKHVVDYRGVDPLTVGRVRQTADI